MNSCRVCLHSRASLGFFRTRGAMCCTDRPRVVLVQNTRVEAGKVLPQLTSLKIKDCGIQPELCVHTPYSRGLFSAFSSAKHPVII
eukprot:1982510-Rhodomonas_salina.2